VRRPLGPWLAAAAASLAVALAVAEVVPARSPATDALLLETPAGERYSRIDRAGETVLPIGRLLTPVGRQIATAPHPFGLSLSADGSVLVTVNGGVGPFSLTVVRDPASSTPTVTQIPPGVETDKRVINSAFLGAAVDTERGLVYASGGDNGTVFVFRLSDGGRVAQVDLSSPEHPDAYTTDIALSPDGRFLFALDLGHYRLVTIDAVKREAVGSVGVGRNPFALALSPDGRRAFIANMGTFQYSFVETREPFDDLRGVTFPPTGYPSKEAREGTIAEGRRVPGLGDPNVDEACSVFILDLARPERPLVTGRIRTGLPVGQSIGGSSPAGLVASAETLFVTNSTNDTVEAYDLATRTRRWSTLLTPALYLRHLRGVLPFGLALSRDGRRLFVAESGLNAVGILDAATGEVRGHIPTAWYPAQLALSADGRTLFVSNAKGFGAGPNGGAGFRPGLRPDPDAAYIGRLMRGTVSVIPVAGDESLEASTARVLANNGLVPKIASRPADHPLPELPGRPSPKIKHVVFIAKENRTFDEVFGDLPGANGDPFLTRFGAGRKVGPYRGIEVMPNHRALARRFAVSDNFYVDSDVSADGHRWLVGAYPNHWVETVTAAGYGGGAAFVKKTKAPGRLALFESNSSLAPEDYLEQGSMWHHLAARGVRFRNFGEGFEFAGTTESEGMAPTGARLPVNVPMPSVLRENTSRDYPSYNTTIPDQYRADVFLRELAGWSSSGSGMPAFIFILLPNDHGDRPRFGYPFLESYMADNDLALGRIVEALSKSPFWKDMAVLVTEDDAQSGVDHVDAHRSLLLHIGPWAKRGHVSHRQASIASITKTIYRLLGLPDLHLYDAAAADLVDLFGTGPDPEPYDALPVDRRIFDPELVQDPADPDYRKVQWPDRPELDDIEEAMRQVREAAPARVSQPPQ
jgi:YVTN family beta-propeller protein